MSLQGGQAPAACVSCEVEPLPTAKEVAAAKAARARLYGESAASAVSEVGCRWPAALLLSASVVTARSDHRRASPSFPRERSPESTSRFPIQPAPTYCLWAKRAIWAREDRGGILDRPSSRPWQASQKRTGPHAARQALLPTESGARRPLRPEPMDLPSQALVLLRRVVVCHRATAEPALARLVPALLPPVKSLRSAVSKSALLAVADVAHAFQVGFAAQVPASWAVCCPG